MDQVFVEGVQFLGRHGVTAKERREGITCRAGLVVDVDTRGAAKTQNLKLTANYARLSAILHTLGTERSYKLLETLAHDVAVAVMEEMPMVARVEVHICKVGLAVTGAPATCGVRLVRTREDLPGR